MVSWHLINNSNIALGRSLVFLDKVSKIQWCKHAKSVHRWITLTFHCSTRLMLLKITSSSARFMCLSSCTGHNKLVSSAIDLPFSIIILVVILHIKVRLVDGNGCAQGLVKLRKAHSPIIGHTYSFQLLDGIKSKQQVESHQFLVHNYKLNTDRISVAHIELSKFYPRAFKDPFTNSEYIHFFPLLKVTK